MEKYKFKTNINCGGCIKSITPHLAKAEGIASWEVDTTNSDKILTVNSNGITVSNIIEIVQRAGYKIEEI